MPLTIPRLVLGSVIPIFCISEVCYSIKGVFDRIRKKTIDAYNYKACKGPSQNQKSDCAQKMSHGVLLPSRSQGFFNFSIGLVLPKGIDRPDHSWNPADHSELHHQAEKTCKWTTNREEGQPRQKKEIRSLTVGMFALFYIERKCQLVG